MVAAEIAQGRYIILMRQRDFPSLDAYYEQDGRRESSDAIDYGERWTERMKILPHWRVTWVEDTGEIYAHNELEGDDEYLEVIGLAATEDEADRVMEGWERECGKSGSLHWIAKKLLLTLPENSPTGGQTPDAKVIRF